MRLLVCGVVSLVVLLTGCRDLSLPPEDGGSTGAGVEGLQLIEPDELALSRPLARATQFRLSVASANGVNQVDLRCGDRVVALWNTEGRGSPEAPVLLQAVVDFTDCVDPQEGAPTPNEIALRIRATDGTDLPFVDLERKVLVDFSQPVITAVLPERVVSGQNLSFLVRSDVPLASPPLAMIDGRPASVTPENAAENSYRVVHTRALELGAARLPPDHLANTAQLEETQRPVSVQITARSATGNEGRLDATLTLTRVAWERSVPGIVFASPALPAQQSVITFPQPLHPVASEGGLTLPIHRSLQTDGGVSWVPGFFAADDGAYRPVPASVLAQANQGGALEQSGAVLLQSLNGTVLRVAFDGTLTSRYDENATSPDWTSQGDRFCRHQVTSSFGQCVADSTHAFQCYTPGQQLPTTVASGSAPDSTLSAGRYAFFAGEHFFSLFGQPKTDTSGLICDPTSPEPSFRIADGQLQPLAPLRSSFDILFNRILPSERGDFALVLQPRSGETLVNRWGLTGTSQEGSLGAVDDFILDAWGESNPTLDRVPLTYRPDGTVLLFPLDVASGTTEIRGQGESGAKLGSAVFYGYYEPLRETVWSHYPYGVFTLTDSVEPELRYTSYILVHRNGRSSGFFSVLAIDHLMRPKWVYHYPRQLQTPLTDAVPLTLSGSSASKYLYLVDEEINAVTAIAR